MQDVYIVSSVRTAVAKAKRGALKNARPEDFGAAAISGAVSRVPGLQPVDVDDVLIGCAMPEGEQGMNMARIIVLRAGFPVTVPAATVNRFCSSGLQTIAMGAQAIAAGQHDVVVAGGAESMSLVPMTGFYYQPNPYLTEHFPQTFIGMGLTAENVAKQYRISREDQDQFAFESHRKAVEALKAGRFNEEIVPFTVQETVYENGSTKPVHFDFRIDEGPRADTTVEALSALRPAFTPKGSVTAGNASQMSDGAAATVLMSGERMRSMGLNPMARMVGYAVAGVGPEVMGIGPVDALKKLSKKTGVSLQDVGLVELNEAFAAQALGVIRESGLNPEAVNVNGGAIALGHPLGCTGAKLTATLLHEMKRRNERYGIVTMCIGGGMGAAALFENLQ
jgi:acetyl-CoA acyltransferase